MRILKSQKDQIKLNSINFIQRLPTIIFAQVAVFIPTTTQDNPSMTGFNVGCIDGIDTFDLRNVSVNDGQNHPLDNK